MILHIPHSSMEVPPDLRSTILLTDAELGRELLAMTDSFTDEIFQLDLQGVRRVVYPVSRLIVDPERFVDDALEPMSRLGMGVIYEHTPDGRRLRHQPSAAERQALLERFYYPHHETLTAACEDELAALGHCLIVDCHSFPSASLLYELNQEPDRPDFCIGTDDFHTPKHLTDRTFRSIKSLGYTVAINRPFAGSLVPAQFYRTDRRVCSIMVEINRRLYLDEATGRRAETPDKVLFDLREILKLIEACTIH